MDEEWKRLYIEERYSLNRIAVMFGTNSHLVKRHLIKMGVELNHENRVLPPVSEEERKRRSERQKGKPGVWAGRKMPKGSLYKNMVSHLRWDVSLDFLTQFEDVERLKCLNKILTRDRVALHFDSEKYRQFVEKFYDDEKFKRQFEIFKASGNKYDRPSLDHIIPLSRGGTWELENLQIISWFENRAKVDMTQEEYDAMRRKYWS